MPLRQKFSPGVLFQIQTVFFTNYIDTVTAGDLVTFSLTGTDNGFLPQGFQQSMTYTAQSGQFGANYTNPNAGCDNLPCATLSLPPPQTAVGTLNVDFNWQTGCEHVALNDECITLSNVHTFTFTFRDDYCPAPSYTVVTATIVVNAITVIQSPHIHCANVLANGDVQLTWDLPIDTDLTYNSYHIYTAANLNGPYTVIDSIFNYNTTTYTHVGAAADVASRYYFVKSRSGCFGQVYAPALDTVQTIFVSIGTPVNNRALSDNKVAIQISIRLFLPTYFGLILVPSFNVPPIMYCTTDQGDNFQLVGIGCCSFFLNASNSD